MLDAGALGTAIIGLRAARSEFELHQNESSASAERNAGGRRYQVARAMVRRAMPRTRARYTRLFAKLGD